MKKFDSMIVLTTKAHRQIEIYIQQRWQWPTMVPHM